MIFFISQVRLVCFLFWVHLLNWRKGFRSWWCGRETELAALLKFIFFFPDKCIGKEENCSKHNNRIKGFQKSLTAPKKVPSPSKDILARLRGIVSWSSSPSSNFAMPGKKKWNILKLIFHRHYFYQWCSKCYYTSSYKCKHGLLLVTSACFIFRYNHTDFSLPKSDT